MGKEWSFKKEFGFEPPRPLGDRVSIIPYVKKLSAVIFQGHETDENLMRETIVGRVAKLGSYAYKGDSYKGWDKEDLPKVGDWVTFKINSGVRYKYGPAGKGVEVRTVFDDAISDLIEEPDYVERV